MRYIGWLAALLAIGGCGATDGERTPEEIASTVLAVDIPESVAAGEELFEANCASCHGNRGLGTGNGPPLVHIIYEPAHHADVAFIMAVERGVRAHHWQFGDMPPVPNVDREQVAQITAYVRHLQRAVGID